MSVMDSMRKRCCKCHLRFCSAPSTRYCKPRSSSVDPYGWGESICIKGFQAFVEAALLAKCRKASVYGITQGRARNEGEQQSSRTYPLEFRDLWGIVNNMLNEFGNEFRIGDFNELLSSIDGWPKNISSATSGQSNPMGRVVPNQQA